MIMKISRILLLQLTIFVMLSSLVAVNTTVANPDLKQTEQVLTYGLPYDFDEYSVWTQDSYATAQWTSAVYAGLFKRDNDNNRDWVPDLAADMPTISGSEFTVTLKDNLKFASGGSLTADDVVFSYKVAVTPSINTAGYSVISQYFNNESFVKIDDKTVKFTFNQPYAFAVSLLAGPIIEKAVFESRYNDCVNGNATACVWDDPSGADAQGAGPYKVDSIDNTNEIVTLVRNENYWANHMVYADKIVYQKIEEKAAAISALVSGSIDIMDSQYVPSVNEFDAYTNVHTEIVSDPVHQEISLNHKSPYWGNGSAVPDGDSSDDAMDALLIRRAMSHIVDRQYIADQILEGLGLPAASTMPAASVGWDPNLKADEYNITLAKELMTEAGFDYSTLTDADNDGVYETFFFEITVLSPNTNPARNQWAANYVQELPKIGIGVKQHVSTGWGDIIPRTFGADGPPGLYDDGGYDIFFVGYGWGLDWDPTGLYEESSFLPTGGNFYNYVNHTLENLISNYTTELDPDVRIEKAHAVQKAIHDDLPVIPLVYPSSMWAWNKDVSGIDGILISTSSQEWGEIHKTGWTLPPAPTTSTTTTTSSTTTNTSSSAAASSEAKKSPISPIVVVAGFVAALIAFDRKRKFTK